MLDLGFVRANLPLVEEKLRQRGADPAAVLGDFEAIDANRRESITRLEREKAERNAKSAKVAELRREAKQAEPSGLEAVAKIFEEITPLQAEVARLKGTIEDSERHAEQKDQELRDILHAIPNLPHDSVPVGKSEQDNVEVKTWGDKPQFDFAPKPHWELGEGLGILDFERAAKVTGARFAVYWQNGAKLERALANFMLDLHTREHGYTEVLPPFLVNSASLFGTGQLPKFAADSFKCEGSDYWLIPTAEVPVTNLYRDETLEEAQLPISLTAYTPCFRSEAGSYGKDVRGLIRQHQFQKVELVKFARPDTSYDEHEKLTRHAEMVLEALGLPYRRMLLCTGDMGFSSAKTYDLEVWLPGQNTYREISSCSNFEAFQARRANIRFRPGRAAAGKSKTEFVHTLNGSALAVGRTWLAVLENYQQADGTVRIPDALVPYMGGETVLRKR